MYFFLRRLGFYLAAFVVACTFNFLLPRMMPGDPVQIMFAQSGSTLGPEAMDALRATFGFVEGPIWQQYLIYLKSVFNWDLGLSVSFYPFSVNDVIGTALPWTLLLVGLSTLISFSLGSLLGIYAAWRRGGLFDSIVSPLALVMQSIPAVVLSILALFVFAVMLGWFPVGRAYGLDHDPAWSFAFVASVAHHAVLPLITLITVQVGGFLVTIRNNMINLLGEDYINMGRAKGLGDTAVMFRYGARNALLPSVTSFAMAFGFIVAGSLITEVIFNYPGLGRLLFNGINARDYPLIQGLLLIITVATLAANFIADLVYVVLDPRLRRS
ncbi:ABC transporter permease [Natronospirillum operosum]|uniref:ABC transporter permease n=1 Tax=Natronospirillum operosum TaxID=2759953 RepID=A0A4Z0W9Q9_9GAMM|nr:ABC transporter permease [Natronospirillum operosum]TGG93909.1 ABC transporter permease [Natronospirillum operosum]